MYSVRLDFHSILAIIESIYQLFFTLFFLWLESSMYHLVYKALGLCFNSYKNTIDISTPCVPKILLVFQWPVSRPQVTLEALRHWRSPSTLGNDSESRTRTRERMAHRGGVEEMLMFGCSFGTEAPSVAGAEGPDGSFRVSRWRQRAKGERARRGSWTAVTPPI